MPDEIHTGYFRVVKRLPSSRNGNPRYLCAIQTDEGGLYLFATGVDSSLGYSAPNHNGARCKVTLKTIRGTATLQTIQPG